MLRSILALFLASGSLSATPFQNLDFEQANTNTSQIISIGFETFGSGPTVDLIPGWQAFEGSSQATTIGYNAADYRIIIGSPGLQGKYAVGMSSLSTSPDFSPSILQLGDIPADAQYLTFDQQVGGATAPPTVRLSLNGQILPDLLSPFNLTNQMFDVSAFQGQTVELRISLDTSIFVGGGTIDDIRFVPVPEPSALALFGLSGAFLLLRFRHRPKRG